MMGTSGPQPRMFSHINPEQFVTGDHPLRKIRLLIDTDHIRMLCERLYSEAAPVDSTGAAVSGSLGRVSMWGINECGG